MSDGVGTASAGGDARIRGVAFDLDGTLIDSYDAIADSLNHALRALGEPALSPERIRRMVGRGLETLVEQAAGRARVPEGVRLFREHYERVAVAGTRLLPGVAETVAELHRRGYRMGVASNKPARFGALLLEALGLGPYLGPVLGPDRVEHPKPHPEMVHRLLREMRLAPGEAVYVGDMDLDVETCRNAGLPCWLVPTGSCSREELEGAGADRLLAGFRDLAGLLPPLR